MKRIFVVICFLMSLSFYAMPHDMKIGIYNHDMIQSVVFSVIEGSYTITADNNEVMVLHTNDNIYITKKGDSILYSSVFCQPAVCRELICHSNDSIQSFKIRSVFPDLKARTYNGNVIMSIYFERLLIINDIPMNLYLGGVIETEGGSTSHIEYYKSQAVICRTYALKNMGRHASEGFNLCDETHCQAYKNKCLWNSEILKAIDSTDNEVIVYNDSLLITAAFHANSGGQTADAADVWQAGAPYLLSKNDPFSTKSSYSNWTVTTTREKWYNYLKSYGYSTKGADLSQINFSFWQNTRKKNYTINGFSLQLTIIREDWKLKSTFFSVIDENGKITIKGKGFGHGVGMSQQGAMQMAKAGYSHKDIIQHYFSGVKIIGYDELMKNGNSLR